jgi:hypothetical protein
MPADSLTPDETASFLLGKALRAAMLDPSNKPAVVDLRAKAWAVYAALCDSVLTVEEATRIRRATGLIDLTGQWDEDARENPLP